MRIEFGRTGAERKEMVMKMGEILGVKPKYMGMPSAAYAVGELTVTKDGAIECEDGTDIRELMDGLKEQGIEPESGYEADAVSETESENEMIDAESENTETANGQEQIESEVTTEQQEGNGLNIEMPRAFFTDAALENLQKIVDSKAELIKKAVGADELPINIGEERVGFPWFTATEAEDAKAYAEFISKLSIMAKEAKRVTAKEKPLDGSSEKYTFHCFLLRLGFIGAEYKQSRKVLMRNLEGSSSFRTGKPETEEGEE